MEKSYNNKVVKNLVRSNYFNEILVALLYVFFCSLIGSIINLEDYISQYQLSLMNAFRRLNTLSSDHDNISAFFLGSCLLYFLFYVFHKKLILLGLPFRKIMCLDSKEKELTEALNQQSNTLKLKYSPQLYIADVDMPNAFASGYREKNSFIVFTKGLIELLDINELKAVLAIQVSHIKLKNIKLTLAISLASNGPILLFDKLFYKLLYKNITKYHSNIIISKIVFLLKTLRFLLPILTILYRYILTSARVNTANQMAIDLLVNDAVLKSALLKIKTYHECHKDLVSRQYQAIPYDKVRREMYLFDPSNFNYAQTLATPFKVQPDLEEQIDTLNQRQANIALLKE